MKNVASPQALEISLLGPVEICVGGVTCESRLQTKVLALLGYLAAERGPHAREHLIDLFWPDTDPITARSNLRVALYRLRQSLTDNGFLRCERDSIMLDPAACRADITDFLTPPAAQAGAVELERHLALYRGIFLAGTNLESCIDFADWLALKRETCLTQALVLADRLIALYQDGKQYAKALHFAKRRLELAPWSEEGHRKNMELLALDGQQGAALAQYENCRKALGRELGVTPNAQTDALYQSIRKGDLAADFPRNPAGGIPAANHRPLHILVVDDHHLLRTGLRFTLGELAPAVTVLESASCEAALSMDSPAQGLDLILLDMKFPGMSGLDSLPLFHERFPETPVVIFSSDMEADLVRASRVNGASGYISKDLEAGAVVSSIRQVLEGRQVFPAGVAC